MALWSGRFESGVDASTQVFGASLPVDIRMYDHDIAGSIAHVRMLSAQGIIDASDAQTIESALVQIKADIDKQLVTFSVDDEDIHMAVERVLIERVGVAGARLHTARSRNDQVATDVRLYMRSLISEIISAQLNFISVICTRIEQDGQVILPGCTHLQPAQPILLGHHLATYAWMVLRDIRHMLEAFEVVNVNPLGACALAGTTYPTNRHMTTELLRMSEPMPNSLDAVSSRDHMIDVSYACAMGMMHLSRLAEEIILWSTPQFGYITLSDAFSTGSSIMPQKKNPDFAELIRGKSGRTFGDVMALLTTMKGLPLAYNKDMQEDKEAAFDACDTYTESLTVMTGMIETLTVNEQACNQALLRGHLCATDIADFLVNKGMPFRNAHAIVGHLVLTAEKKGIDVSELSLADFQEASELFDEGLIAAIQTEAVVSGRTSFGGTAPVALAEQMKLLDDKLSALTPQIEHVKWCVDYQSALF